MATIIGIHGFTPLFHGLTRPWHAGILFRKSAGFATALIKELHEPGMPVAADEAYVIKDDGDCTVHGEARGLDAILVENRRDLIADNAGVAIWALGLHDALQRLAARIH